MTVGGLCESCGRFSPGLFTCHACGSKVGPECVVDGTPFCNICKGRKTIGNANKIARK